MVEIFNQCIIYYLVIVLVLRIMRFVSSPFLRWVGYYKYYSPMFFTMPTPTALEIHLGTSYDFINQQGRTPKDIIKYLAEGLVNLCEAIENGLIDRRQVIKGTIYYMNDSTLKQFGFASVRPGPFHWLLFIQNYLEVLVLQMISKRKLCYVNLLNVRRVHATAGDILKYRDKYRAYLTYLKKIKTKTNTHHPREGLTFIQH